MSDWGFEFQGRKYQSSRAYLRAFKQARNEKLNSFIKKDPSKKVLIDLKKGQSIKRHSNKVESQLANHNKKQTSILSFSNGN